MILSDYLNEQCILAGAEGGDKTSIIREIAGLAKNSPVLEKVDEEHIFKKLMEREKLGSTGFGNKIAIPHCSIDNISDFVIGIITVEKGIKFDSLDGKDTHVFVFIIAPSTRRNQHIRCLSAISSVLRQQSAVNEILAAKTPRVVLESFLRFTHIKDEKEERVDYNLIQVVVQLEEKFEDVLSVFTEVQDCNITVLEANNAGNYLYTLPLFSNFWNEEQKGYNRFIVAAVDKSRSNEIVRKLNMIIETLEEKTGIMILIQDVVYLNGALNL